MPLGAVRHTGEAAIVLCQVPEGRQTVDERRDIIPVEVAKLNVGNNIARKKPRLSQRARTRWTLLKR